MNDDSPFAAFVPSSPEVSAPAEAKNKKGRKPSKKKAEAKPFADPPGYAKGDVISVKSGGKGATATVTVATPKKERKKRVAKAPREMKLDLGVALDILYQSGGSLTEDEVELLKQTAGTFGNVPKKSRAKVAAALAKIFA